MEKLTGVFFIATIFALGLAAGPDRDPIWPNEFLWSSAGPKKGYHCTHILETADKHTWHDNYFCQKAGKGIKNIGMTWSSAGPIQCMRCTRIIELADKAGTWLDNYLCVPKESFFLFEWSMAGPIPGKHCIRWIETAEPAQTTWRDNYLCADKFPMPKITFVCIRSSY